VARIQTLFVVLKLVERCNLACTYCYYYAPGNDDVASRPSLMGEQRLAQVVEYLETAVTQASISNLVIVLHGGEPTLAKPSAVANFLANARAALKSRVGTLRFALQTNGVFLPPAWTELIEREWIEVSISLDGNRETNDAARVDHRGKGSYDRVEASIRLLRGLADAGRIAEFGVISVMGSAFKGLSTYRHLVGALGIRRIKLLFVDHTHDTLKSSRAELQGLGDSLCDIFDHWLLNDSERVEVNLFTETVRRMLAESRRVQRSNSELTLGIAILSDGTVRIADEYMVASSWYAKQQRHSIMDSRFIDWAGQPMVQSISQATVHPPRACSGCPHIDSCSGGDVPHRYSDTSAFDRSSSYCAALMRLHDHVAARLAECAVQLPAAAAALVTRRLRAAEP
jgi:uncharacterized protein